MSLRLFIPGELPSDINEGQLEQLFEVWLEIIKPQLKGDILLQVVDRDAMCEISRAHQGYSGATDVLSFNYEPPLAEKTGELIGGEIIVCEDVARDNANKLNVDFEVECATLFVHGLLHLSGRDHGVGRQRQAFELETHAIMERGGLTPVSLWLD